MPVVDILSTTERIRRLKNAISDLRLSIQASKNAEKIYQELIRQTGYVDFEEAWDEITYKTGIANTAATSASATLTDMISTQFVFQYKWVIGTAGIEGFYFDPSATPDEITIISNETHDVAKPFGDSVVILENDKLLVEGVNEEDNLGILTVAASPTSTAIKVTDSLTLETCSNAGASITLIRRGTA